MPTFQKASNRDFSDWQKLWLENCDQLGMKNMTSDVINGLWQRILSETSDLDAWLVYEGEEPVALAHTILHCHTFSLNKVCCLEDLWVTPIRRRKGVARFTIEEVRKMATSLGCQRLYWQTSESNFIAQKLYDDIAVRKPYLTYEWTI